MFGLVLIWLEVEPKPGIGIPEIMWGGVFRGNELLLLRLLKKNAAKYEQELSGNIVGFFEAVRERREQYVPS